MMMTVMFLQTSSWFAIKRTITFWLIRSSMSFYHPSFQRWRSTITITPFSMTFTHNQIMSTTVCIIMVFKHSDCTPSIRRTHSLKPTKKVKPTSTWLLYLRIERNGWFTFLKSSLWIITELVLRTSKIIAISIVKIIDFSTRTSWGYIGRPEKKRSTHKSADVPQTRCSAWRRRSTLSNKVATVSIWRARRTGWMLRMLRSWILVRSQNFPSRRMLKIKRRWRKPWRTRRNLMLRHYRNTGMNVSLKSRSEVDGADRRRQRRWVGNYW
jgi:hypothetical protein